eukprot:ANDGO_03682.mRNA.1 hypothetical protein
MDSSSVESLLGRFAHTSAVLFSDRDGSILAKAGETPQDLLAAPLSATGLADQVARLEKGGLQSAILFTTGHTIVHIFGSAATGGLVTFVGDAALNAGLLLAQKSQLLNALSQIIGRDE